MMPLMPALMLANVSPKIADSTFKSPSGAMADPYTMDSGTLVRVTSGTFTISGTGSTGTAQTFKWRIDTSLPSEWAIQVKVAITAGTFYVHTSTSTTDATSKIGLQLKPTQLELLEDATTACVARPLTSGTTYTVTMSYRNNEVCFYISGGAFTTTERIWLETSHTLSSSGHYLFIGGAGFTGTISDLKVLNAIDFASVTYTPSLKLKNASTCTFYMRYRASDGTVRTAKYGAGTALTSAGTDASTYRYWSNSIVSGNRLIYLDGFAGSLGDDWEYMRKITQTNCKPTGDVRNLFPPNVNNLVGIDFYENTSTEANKWGLTGDIAKICQRLTKLRVLWLWGGNNPGTGGVYNTQFTGDIEHLLSHPYSAIAVNNTGLTGDFSNATAKCDDTFDSYMYNSDVYQSAYLSLGHCLYKGDLKFVRNFFSTATFTPAPGFTSGPYRYFEWGVCANLPGSQVAQLAGAEIGAIYPWSYLPAASPLAGSQILTSELRGIKAYNIYPWASSTIPVMSGDLADMGGWTPVAALTDAQYGASLYWQNYPNSADTYIRVGALPESLYNDPYAGSKLTWINVLNCARTTGDIDNLINSIYENRMSFPYNAAVLINGTVDVAPSAGALAKMSELSSNPYAEVRGVWTFTVKT